MKLILRIVTVIILSSAVTFAAEEGKGKAPAKSEKKAAEATGDAPKKLPLMGTVVAVTTRTLTLKGGEGKEDRKFTINKDTQILKGENPATTADVTVGQKITGSYYKTAEGAGVLSKLQVAPKSSSEPKKEGDTKKKTEGESKKKAEGETTKKKSS